jgi:hypothetical protein
MSDAMIGHGCRVYVETADSPNQSPPDYHELSEINNITPPQSESEDVDVTHMQSPNKVREFVGGLVDPGDAGFELNWVPGSDTDKILLALKRDQTIVSWKFQWPNGTYWEFLGYVKTYNPSAETGDKMTAEVAIKVSGDSTPSYDI